MIEIDFSQMVAACPTDSTRSAYGLQKDLSLVILKTLTPESTCDLQNIFITYGKTYLSTKLITFTFNIDIPKNYK